MKYAFYLLFFVLIGCNKSKGKSFEYYIISKEDAEIEKHAKEGKYLLPTIPQELKWYSNLVLIIDSTNVYLYQTLEKERFGAKKIEDYDFPNFIELEPRHLTTIPGKDFLSFIKANNDILELIKKPENRASFFQIASTTDTIKNKAYYDLGNFLGKEKRAYYKVRKITEEESKVLDCKIRNKAYKPNRINWSKNFIHGKFSPYTKEYFDEEKNSSGIRKSIETFKRNSYERMIYM